MTPSWLLGTVGLPNMILIVDDHLDTCEVLARLCHKKGLPAQYVLTGEEALARLRAQNPDEPSVVVLDHMMPGTSGLDVLETLHHEGRLNNVKVLFLSAVFDWELYQRALRLGARAWLVKGTLHLNEVVDQVANCYGPPAN